MFPINRKFYWDLDKTISSSKTLDEILSLTSLAELDFNVLNEKIVSFVKKVLFKCGKTPFESLNYCHCDPGESVNGVIENSSVEMIWEHETIQLSWLMESSAMAFLYSEKVGRRVTILKKGTFDLSEDTVEKASAFILENYQCKEEETQ